MLLRILFQLIIVGFVTSQSCNVDSDCNKLNLDVSLTDLSTLANYYCVNKECKYLVKAGEFCNQPSDCLAYEYFKRTNQTLSGTNFCSPDFCTLESACDGAWSLSNAPKSGPGSSCCSGVPLEGTCPAPGLTNVDVCGYATQCNPHDKGPATCQKGKEQKTVWIGCLLVLLGGAVLNLGLNIQKFALNYHNKQPPLEPCGDATSSRIHSQPTSRSNSKYNSTPNAMVDSEGHPSEDLPESSRRLNIVINRENSTSKSAPASPTLPSPRGNHRRTLSRASIPHSVRSFSTAYQSVKEKTSRWARFVQRVMKIWNHSIVNPMWVFGLLVYAVGAVLNFVSLQFAPQSLVGPLGSVSLITNIILAPLINKEKISRWDFVGIIMIIGGCVLVVIFSGIVSQNYRICVLFALFKKLQTIIYLIVICSFILASFFYIHTVENNMAEPVVPPNPHLEGKTSRPHSPHLEPVTEVNTSDHPELNGQAVEKKLTDANCNDSETKKPWYRRVFFTIYAGYINFMNKITPTFKTPLTHASRHYKYSLPIAYAVIASLMATLTTMFAKTLANLFTESVFHGRNQFNNWLSWIILIVVVTTALLQLVWITMGLQRYDALLQVPVFYVIWTVFDIIGGGIYFNEFAGFSPLQFGMFALGVLIIFSGVGVLAHRMKDAAI